MISDCAHEPAVLRIMHAIYMYCKAPEIFAALTTETSHGDIMWHCTHTKAELSWKNRFICAIKDQFSLEMGTVAIQEHEFQGNCHKTLCLV